MNQLRARGFTLLELMVTVALIGLFATMALPLQELAVKRSKEVELRNALREIRSALDAYKLASEEGKIPAVVGESGYPKTLNVLISDVRDIRNPNAVPIRFLRRIPRDPWAPPNQKPEDTWGLRSYASSHDAPRRGEDVYDVYSLNDGVGINGIPYRQW